MPAQTKYRLFYWPGIQGRGEFVRLALEEGGADYADLPPRERRPAFAPPYLQVGKQVISQTPAILLYLGDKLGLAPARERLRLHGLQLTIADWLVEVHDTHHPIASSLHYEEQKHEAKRRARIFLESRLPKYLHYFDNALDDRFSYVHLSLFQMIEGLRYAFPQTMKKFRARRLFGLHRRVAARPRIARYLASGRRIPFNQHDIFRHYPELEA